jgi:N-formylglutamate amidohydrolase
VAELTVEVLAGADARAVPGGAVTPRLRVTRDGTAAPDVRVEFAIISGGGTVLDASVRTGIDGSATTAWLLGPAPGEQRLRATVEGGAVEFAATAEIPADGTSHEGRNGYIEYVAGSLPVIIAAPHGGNLQPSEIPDRSSGTTVQDLNTEDLARRIAAEIHALTGMRPHLAVTRLHRRKLDNNREIVEAAQGNPHAERAWHEYHGFLDAARHRLREEHGGGILIDVHGHGHSIQRLELGYLLTASNLELPDAQLDAATYRDRSSVRSLATRAAVPFSALIRGEQSLGSLLAANGFPSVPSSDDPSPEGEPYFTGGYTTARHGSRDGGPVDAIQLEANRRGVRDTAEERQQFAEAFAAALLEYLRLHTEHDLAAYAAPVTLATPR